MSGGGFRARSFVFFLLLLLLLLLFLVSFLLPFLPLPPTPSFRGLSDAFMQMGRWRATITSTNSGKKNPQIFFFFFFLFLYFIFPPFQDFISLLLLLLLPWRDAFHQSCPVSRRVVVYYSEEESGGGRGLSLSSQGYVRDDLYAAVTFWPFAPPHAGGGHPLSQALLVVVVRSTFETRRDFLKLRGQQIYQKKKLGHLPSYVCGIRCIFEFVTLARLKSPVGNAVKLGGNLQQKEKPCCIKSLATK